MTWEKACELSENNWAVRESTVNGRFIRMRRFIKSGGERAINKGIWKPVPNAILDGYDDWEPMVYPAGKEPTFYS